MSPAPALFAFGTLMDPDVLRVVGQQDLSSLVLESATVDDHARRWVRDDHYPVLVPSPGVRTQGLIIRGLHDEARRRIRFFEGEEFTLRELVVVTAAGASELVSYFADNRRKPVDDLAWSLEDWQRTTKAAMLPRVERYMACYGLLSTIEADDYW